jgi:RHS repeat-associated protein
VGGVAYTYDTNQNLKGDGTHTFTYDAENRLLTVVGGAGLQVAYDPLGRIKQTTSASVTTQFLYDGDRLSGEYSNAGTLLRRYVHGPGLDEPLVWYEGTGTTDKRYFHTDERGSVIATSNSSGVGTLYKYGPYGEQSSWTGPAAASRFRYTGQIVLPEAQLYYYKARVYDPDIGRFLQTDSVGYEDDFNLYTYVGNDPLDRTDPTGKLPQDFVDFSAGVGDVALAVVSLGLWDGAEIRRVLMDDAGSVNTNSSAYKNGFLTGVLGTAGLGEIAASGRLEAAAAAPKTIVIDSAKYPESAAHAAAAQAAGKPSVLTVDRAGAPARRSEAMQGTKPTPGKDRDEYPPAMFKEGGKDASLRSINSGDNRGAGASMGHQCSSVGDGSKVRIVCN